jgi:acyl-CoA reductase-like NAD-dependent aldehyde dehydrogenase
MNFLNNYINGSWVDSVCKETFVIVNPATGDVLANVPFGDATTKDGHGNFK